MRMLVELAGLTSFPVVSQFEFGGSLKIVPFQVCRKNRIAFNGPRLLASYTWHTKSKWVKWRRWYVRCPSRLHMQTYWTMQETPYANINRLLESLLSHIRHILQAKLVGLYLYGSLRTGDFDPESSDIDLLAATSSDVSDTEFEALHTMHRNFARDNPKWEDRVEVAYLSVTALRTFRSKRSPIAVISPGEPFHMKEAGRDWLMNWYVVRERGLALFGPPPMAIIGPITQKEFVQAVREHAAAYGEWIKHMQHRKAQAYAILTMCRAFYTHNKGEQVSKKQAALWVQETLPEWSRLVQNALIWRGAWREEQVDHAATYPETVRFVNFVRDQILA